ncbi:MAG: hypothetical protein M3Y72_12205 [Acidobacteriota bacterium]|nr:hypothetical protein [Acidobacteriota bacterium]
MGEEEIKSMHVAEMRVAEIRSRSQAIMSRMALGAFVTLLAILVFIFLSALIDFRKSR